MRRVEPAVAVLLALAAFAWLPLVMPGYFLRAHDAQHTLFFLQAFDAAIRDGHWWPAWGPHFALGYGYPLWIYYAPLTYFAAEAIHLLGAGPATAVKALYIFATAGATLAMYWWTRRHLSAWGAAFAALVYTYAPYHLLDLYVRSAAAEYLTFVFFPLAMGCWEALVEEPRRRNALAAALVTAALILTHHGAAFMFAVLLGAYVLFLLVRCWRAGSARAGALFAHLAAASALTLGLSAIFWLPMLLEQRYIAVEQWTSVAYNYQKHFVHLNQFFSPFWGFGYSGEELADGMGFQLGIVPVASGIVALITGARARARVVFFMLASLLIAAAMTPISAAFWSAVPIAALVQFPWRLLAMSAITLAWLAGAAFDGVAGANPVAQEATDPGRASAVPVAWDMKSTRVLLLLAVVLASFEFTLPQYTPRSPASESARAAVDFELVSYRDRVGYVRWVTQQPQDSPLVKEYESGAPLTRAVVVRGDARIEPLYIGAELHRVRVLAADEAVIQFRVYYFPGWRASVDGKPAPVEPLGPYGLNTLVVPPGDHLIELRFEDTNVRALAKLISAASLAVMLGWVLATRIANRRSARRVASALCLAVLTGSLVACDALGDAAPPEPTAVATREPGVNTPVPTATETPTITPTSPPPTTTSTPRPTSVQHTVLPNETLGGIALKYGSTVAAIMAANNIGDPRFVRVGQVLTVPLPTPMPTATATATADPRLPTAPPAATPIVYVVKAGDVLSLIAARYRIPVDEIMRANDMTDTLVRVGQQLVIPAATATPTITTTPLPTATPTPGLPFGAAQLLFPPEGAVLTGTEPIVLNWTAVGALGPDQYYVLRLRAAGDSPRTESVWLKSPSHRLPATWRGGAIQWDVTVLQLLNTRPDGTRDSKIASPMSATRTFTWR